MKKDNVAIAEAYYTNWGNKNLEGMAQFLHPDVRVLSPVSEMIGKECVVEALTKGVALLTSLNIRAKFGSEDQAMIVFDLNFPAPIGTLPSASLLTIRDGLIVNIELFYNNPPVEAVAKEEFFAQ